MVGAPQPREQQEAGGGMGHRGAGEEVAGGGAVVQQWGPGGRGPARAGEGTSMEMAPGEARTPSQERERMGLSRQMSGCGRALPWVRGCHLPPRAGRKRVGALPKPVLGQEGAPGCRESRAVQSPNPCSAPSPPAPCAQSLAAVGAGSASPQRTPRTLWAAPPERGRGSPWAHPLGQGWGTEPGGRGLMLGVGHGGSSVLRGAEVVAEV